MRFFTKTTAFLAMAAMAMVAFSSSVQASDVQLAPRAQDNDLGPRGLIISTVETLVKKANDVFGHQDEQVIVAKDIVEAKAPAPRAEDKIFSRNEAAIGTDNTRVHARDLGKRAFSTGLSLRSDEMLLNLRAKGGFCECCKKSPADLCCGGNPHCSCGGCPPAAQMEEKDVLQLRAFTEDYEKRNGGGGAEIAF